MSKVDQGDEIWYELRLIIVLYLCLNIAYTILLYLVYGQEPSQDWPSLLQDLMDALKKGKEGRAYVLIVALYVVLTTLPLLISSFFVATILNRRKEWGKEYPGQTYPALQLLYLISLAAILPFGIYFYFIDRSAFYQVIGAVKSDKCSNLPCYSASALWELCKFYYFQYKFPLTVASLILGSWASYRIEKHQGTAQA